MNERILARGAEGSGGWLESACKLTINFRTGILLITVIWLGSEQGDKKLVAAALVVSALASFVPLRYWDRVGPALVRHPAYLAAELVLATLILLLTGVDSPFFYYTLGTALLGGLVYGRGGAVLFSVMLIGVYAWVVLVWKAAGEIDGSFQTYVMLPALYPVVAAAGAGARRLLDRQAEAEAKLAEEQRRAATEGERARLARDMHDSLAKTVSGIGFAALALARHIERDPVGAAAEARRLAADAGQATREAREIIVGLRADSEGTLPLPVSLRAEAERWAAGADVELEVAVEEVGELNPAAARELEWILREALSNVERHAHASHVAVRLRRLGERVVLTVSDDGAGFDVPDRLDDLTQGRHFGVSGMSERALLAGGELSVESAPGEGCVLSAWLPAAAPAVQAAPSAYAAPAAEIAAEPAEPPAGAATRTVPGYTWQ